MQKRGRPAPKWFNNILASLEGDYISLKDLSERVKKTPQSIGQTLRLRGINGIFFEVDGVPRKFYKVSDLRKLSL